MASDKSDAERALGGPGRDLGWALRRFLSAPAARRRRAALLAGLALGLATAACSGPAPVVEAAAAAAAAGDRHGLLSHLTPRSRAVMEALWQAQAGPGGDGTPPLAAGALDVLGVEGLPPASDGTSRVRLRYRETGPGGAPPREGMLVLHGASGAWRIDLPDTEREAALTGLGGRF